MTKHLLKCKSCPLVVKEDYAAKMKKSNKLHDADSLRSDKSYMTSISRQESRDTNSSDSDQTGENIEYASDSEAASCRTHAGGRIIEESSSKEVCNSEVKRGKPKELLLQPLTRFLDYISQQEQTELQESMAKEMYASGAPLNMVENPYWKDFFCRAHPSFILPSRHAVSNPLLDKVSHDIESKLNDSNSLTIISDGWSNIRNESIINFIVAVPEPFFYKSIEPGENRHTAEYMAQAIEISLQLTSIPNSNLQYSSNLSIFNLLILFTLVQ